MRKHIRVHILVGKVSGNKASICDFCGRDSCENILKKTSQKEKVYYKVYCFRAKAQVYPKRNC